MTIEYNFNNVDKSWKNNEGRIDIFHLLSTEYGDISDLTDDEMFLQKDTCDIFYELTFKGYMVGFATYDIIGNVHYILTGLYLQSDEFYSTVLFNEVKRQLQQSHILSIQEPTKKIIRHLIRYGFAKKLNNYLVISAINFNLNTKTLKSYDNQKITNHNRLYLTNIYDIKQGISLSLHIFNRLNYTCYYSDSVESHFNDDKEQLDKIYFDKLVSYILDYDDIIEKTLFYLRNNIHNAIESEEAITNAMMELSQKISQMHDDGKISANEAKVIQEQLFDELDDGDVYLESLNLRLNYLSEHISDDTTDEKILVDECPYCQQELDRTELYCPTCGFVYVDLTVIDENSNIDELIYFNSFMDEISSKYSLYSNKEKQNQFDTEYLLNLAISQILYFISQDEYDETVYFDVRRMLNLEDYNIWEIIEEKQYISYNLDKHTWNKIANSYKVPELKAILKEFNQKTSGRKAELINRISENVSLEYLQSDTPHLTAKGQKFLDDNQIIMVHYTYLKDYVYSEFEQYCQENPMDIVEQLISFVDEHIEHALYSRNQYQLTRSLSVQAKISSEKGDFRQVLQFELQKFLIDLNMIYLKEEYIQYAIPIQKATAGNLILLKNINGINDFKRTFKQIYKTFDENTLRISFKDTSEILSQVLVNSNITKLNAIIKSTYYKGYMNKLPQRDKSNKDSKESYKTTLDDFF